MFPGHEQPLTGTVEHSIKVKDLAIQSGSRGNLNNMPILMEESASKRLRDIRCEADLVHERHI